MPHEICFGSMYAPFVAALPCAYQAQQNNTSRTVLINRCINILRTRTDFGIREDLVRQTAFHNSHFTAVSAGSRQKGNMRKFDQR